MARHRPSPMLTMYASSSGSVRLLSMTLPAASRMPARCGRTGLLGAGASSCGATSALTARVLCAVRRCRLTAGAKCGLSAAGVCEASGLGVASAGLGGRRTVCGSRAHCWDAPAVRCAIAYGSCFLLACWRCCCWRLEDCRRPSPKAQTIKPDGTLNVFDQFSQPALA